MTDKDRETDRQTGRQTDKMLHSCVYVLSLSYALEWTKDMS